MDAHDAAAIANLGGNVPEAPAGHVSGGLFQRIVRRHRSEAGGPTADGPVGFARCGTSCYGRRGGFGIAPLLGGHHLANVVLGLLELRRLLEVSSVQVISGDAVEAHAHAAGQAGRPCDGHDGRRAEGRGLLLQPCRSVVRIHGGGIVVIRFGIGIAFRFGIRSFVDDGDAVAVSDDDDDEEYAEEEEEQQSPSQESLMDRFIFVSIGLGFGWQRTK